MTTDPVCDACARRAIWSVVNNCLCSLPGDKNRLVACSPHLAAVIRLFTDSGHRPHNGARSSEVVVSSLKRWTPPT